VSRLTWILEPWGRTNVDVGRGAMIPICIFAKPPVPAEVKTRLIPALGAAAAAELASAMLLDVWRTVELCPGVRPILATTLPGDFPVSVSPDDVWLQGDGDLGERIERIFNHGLLHAPAVIAVGADSPALTIAHLQAALDALQTNDVVVGPSTDGGFYLLGLRSALCPARARATNACWGAQSDRRCTLVVDADTTPPVHALKEIRKHMESPLVVGGNFGLIFDGPSRAARQLTAIYPMLRILGLCYGDSGIFIRREAYDRIGGFRALSLFEDLDLLRRLRRDRRFVHLPCKILTSSRRFEQRDFALVWLHWTALQVLYWCRISPNWLTRWYGHIRRGIP
jgi:glycosyltransferase A (GT-A) superfamily protein (DUF2064 family)